MNLKKKLQFLFAAAYTYAVLLPAFVFAADSTGARPAGGTPPPATGGGSGIGYRLENPLAFKTLQDFIVAILNVIIIIATPIVVIFIVLAGFKYVTARGNPAEIQKATTALTYAVIGGVLILGAVAIAEIIKNLVTSFSA